MPYNFIMLTCPRCSYIAPNFPVFVKHCRRKRPCLGNQDIDLRELADTMVDERAQKKQYPCDVCNKRYSTKASLRMHTIKLHKSEKSEDASPSLQFDFGQEDLMPLFQDSTISDFLIQHKEKSNEEIFKHVVQLIYSGANKTIKTIRKPISIQLSIRNKGIWMVVDQTTEKKRILQKVKQKVCMVIQHPMTKEDDDLQEYINTIGKDVYTNLEQLTNNIDNIDDLVDFDEETDFWIYDALI